MVTSGDLTQMAADLAKVSADNVSSIVIRRGSTTLTAQSVRIARTGGGGPRDSGPGQETRGSVVMVGAASLNVQPGDRFNAGGLLYRVVFVRPNRLVMTAAECEVVQ